MMIIIPTKWLAIIGNINPPFSDIFRHTQVSTKNSKFLPGENVHLGLPRAQAIQHLAMAIHRQRARTPHSELVDGVELHVPQGFFATEQWENMTLKLKLYINYRLTMI